MTRAEFSVLRRRFNFACGYCGVHETGVGAALTVDHFHPTSRGGSDEAENWVYSCSACNTFKGAFWSEDETQRLLKPLHDDFSRHLELRGDELFGLTPRGTTHIERLHLNREQLRAQRTDFESRRQFQERLQRAEDRLERALQRIDEANLS